MAVMHGWLLRTPSQIFSTFIEQKAQLAKSDRLFLPNARKCSPKFTR